ncbi:MAG: hypothetical protein Kow0031_39640 [Anaerolineae bacterium]
MANQTQISVKEALIQIFEQLSAERKIEVLDFALFVQARESKGQFDKNAEADSTSVSPPLRGSVLHYADPFEPVAVNDWELPQ